MPRIVILKPNPIHSLDSPEIMSILGDDRSPVPCTGDALKASEKKNPWVMLCDRCESSYTKKFIGPHRRKLGFWEGKK